MKRTLVAVLCLTSFWLAGASAVRADTLRVGVSLADLGNPFFYALAQHLQDAANEQSSQPVEMTVVSSAYDLQRQQAQIQRFIDDRVDIILLSAADSMGIEPSIHQARQAGITVTAVDIDAQGADLSVTTDNVQAGMEACRYLAERMGSKGDLGIINGASVSSVTDRVAGCRAVLQDYPEIRLVSDSRRDGAKGNGSEPGAPGKTVAKPAQHSDSNAFDHAGIVACRALTQGQPCGRWSQASLTVSSCSLSCNREKNDCLGISSSPRCARSQSTQLRPLLIWCAWCAPSSKL